MRIGILGGSFDPIHYGHLEMAYQAKTRFRLDRVLLMVADTPPHKSLLNRTPAEIRLDIATAALSDPKYEGIAASDLELKIEGINYTATTLLYYHSLHPDDELFFIMGADMLTSFHTWSRPGLITKLASLIVFKRPTMADEEKFQRSIARVKKDFSADIYVAEADIPDLSSTVIRQRVFDALPISDYMPHAAEMLLYEKLLYQPADIRFVALDMRERLTPQRFAHSTSTMREAIYLADKYGADRIKCRMAGFIHDCEKLSTEETKKRAKLHNIQLDKYEIESPGLIHAKLGAYIIKVRYGIDDPELEGAIAKHTLAAPNMTDLEMITYLADCTESLRTYEGVDEIREAANVSLKEGMLTAIAVSEKMLKEKGKSLHPQTIAAREWLLGI